MTETTRRQLITRTAGVAAAVTAAAAATEACSGGGPSNTGGSVTQDAGSVNDLQSQEEKLTIAPFNRVKAIPDQAYPASLIRDSLEMRNLHERLLRFNDANKLGWAYLFTPAGQLILQLPVKGKISSTQSAMTTSVGVYRSNNAGHDDSGGGNVAVEVPGDDLSFGPNEGGPAGKFFFTPDDVYVFWDGPILYLDAPLNVLEQPTVVKYNAGSRPSNTAPKA